MQSICIKVSAGVLVSMLQRFTTLLLLACYSVIALGGQGLHLLANDCACTSGECEVACEAKPTECSHRHKCGHTHRHSSQQPSAKKNGADPSVAHAATKSSGSSGPAIRSQSSGNGHDCEHCALCQHQSLGQIISMSPPAISGPVVCDTLCSLSAESALCPALHSSAQPRAPPAV
jgi:hypothetical protein